VSDAAEWDLVKVIARAAAARKKPTTSPTARPPIGICSATKSQVALAAAPHGFAGKALLSAANPRRAKKILQTLQNNSLESADF